MVFGFDFGFLVLVCLSPLKCSIMILNIKSDRLKVTGKHGTQTGNALMNANKKQNYVFFFYDQSLLTQ